MHRKNNRVPVLYAWVHDPAVIMAYIKNISGGTNLLRPLRCFYAVHVTKKPLNGGVSRESNYPIPGWR